MDKMPYEILDCPIGVCLEVKAASLPILFESVAFALFDAMFKIKKPQIPSIDVPIAVEADSPSDLMVKWIQELFFIYASRHIVLVNFWMDEVDEHHVVASVKGVKFDAAKHECNFNIKDVSTDGCRVDICDDGACNAHVEFYL